METLTVQPAETELPDDLAVILTRAKARSKKRYRSMGIIAGITLSIIPIALITANLPHGIVFLALIASVYEFCMVAHGFSTVMRGRKGAYGLNEQDLTQLSAINDKRVLKVLLEVSFSLPNKPIALRRKELLKHWLPSLTSEDAYLLSKRQKQHLASGIHIFKDDVTREILRALKHIGDADQLSSLRGWKLKQAGMRLEPETIAAYTSCIAAIKARENLSRSDSQLLRPSSPDERADTYLRPVEQKPDEDADTLLRAKTGEEE